MFVLGKATPEGTRRFSLRFSDAAPGHFRCARELVVSSLGLGTFAGEPDDRKDEAYAAAIERALELGCNVLDTAVAYRHQRSERTVGRVLRRVLTAQAIRRDEVVVSTKAGFIPFDSSYPGEPGQYFEETFVKPGILTGNDVVAGLHCLKPEFLRHQVETSRRNLGCETIDVFYLHNPETQLRGVTRDEFRRRISDAFQVLELSAKQGHIGIYGVSTWDGCRVEPNSRDYLSIEELVRCAFEVAGPDHSFQAIMVPFNLAKPEAFAFCNQWIGHGTRPVCLLEAARALGLTAFAGSALHLGRLAKAVPDGLSELMNSGFATAAQYALQFARSAPGLASVMVGMSSARHVEENLGLMRIPSLSARQFADLFRDREECVN